MYPVKQKDNCKVTLPFNYTYPNEEPFKSWGMAGNRHLGVDIARKDKTIIYEIVTPVDGIVANAGWGDKEGWYCSIDSTMDDKAHHILLHMEEVRVKKGQKVKKGQIIGVMGSTGHSTGVHLHYGVRKGNKYIDPKVFMT